MNRVIEYHRRLFSLPKGKLIWLAQVILIVVAMWLFIKNIPWVMSHDISEIEQYSDSSPSPPEWARAFSVNHGDFIYYEESRSDAPAKFWAAIILFIIYGLVMNFWTRWVWKQDASSNLKKSNNAE